MLEVAKNCKKIQKSTRFFAKNCKKVQEIAKKCAFLLKNAEEIRVFRLIVVLDVVGQYVRNGSGGRLLLGAGRMRGEAKALDFRFTSGNLRLRRIGLGLVFNF